jgi:hypothetical protein
MTKPKPHVADEDVAAFIAQWLTRLSPALSPDKRADAAHDFIIGYLKTTEPDKSDEWISEFARRVREKVRWMEIK